MKKIFAVLGLAAVTMGSCTTDISEDVTNARGTTELTAALEGTRTHLGDKDGNTGLYKVYWSNGDCIATVVRATRSRMSRKVRLPRRSL